MKKLSYILFAVAAVALTGCKDFLDVNKSRDAVTRVTCDQSLPVIVFYMSQINYDHAEYGVYLSQALTTPAKSQTGNYPYSQGWEFLSVNRHPMWRRHFYDIGANVNAMTDAAREINSTNFILIGRTAKLESTLFTTDVFGPMPRSQAYTSTSPGYDSQEEIYDWLFQEADDLVAAYADSSYVNNPGNMNITKKMDRIYAGDMKKWALYTKALRCRLWLRKLPNWDNNPATCQKIISMVDEILNDPDWTEPLYRYDGGTSEQNCPWGPSKPIINSWESRANRLDESMPTTFFAYGILGCYGDKITSRGVAVDPRADRLLTPREGAQGGGSDYIRYLESNIGMPVSDKITYYPDLYATSGHNPYTANNGYVALMTTEELMFIKAEAQYWAGDKSGAYETTRAATVLNLERYGVVESELTGSYAPRRYRLFFEVKLPGAASFTIADLMQQKYVAMYLQPEQWTDLRRYNYSSKTNGILYDGVPVYTVTRCHNGGTTNLSNDKKVETLAAEFTREYSLRRPFNLYEPYWCTSEDYGTNAELSPNAWVMRYNPDPETEDKYNRNELIRLGAYKDYRWLKKRMIWGHNTSNKATSADPSIQWQ